MFTRIAALSSVVVLCALALTLSVCSYAQAPKALLLFGGEDHKTFLGCLNCGVASPLSVCNVAGQFGSVVSATSIWNVVGNFGSIVSSESPWNLVASDPPVIVDKDGNSYGYFTENLAHDQTRIPGLVAILDYFDKKGDLDKAQDRMCGSDDDDDDN